jgi:hypothetical protein
MLRFLTKKTYFLIIALLFLLFESALGAPQKAESSIPPKVLNQIYWEIQKQMSFSSQNETTSLLWTPQKIVKQNEEVHPQPQLNPYSPNEIFYVLLFDVSMGHNMDTSDIYWRQCQVQIASIDDIWGEPQVHCNTTNP